MTQRLESSLQETFALGRVGMNRRSNILEPRTHFER